MASKKKGTKGKVVVRKVSVPQGTRQFLIQVTVVSPAKKKGKKMMKSGIIDDPGSGG